MENAESYPIPLIAHNFLQEHNAALRCEQRDHRPKPYHRKHETQRWNEKCQALGITLKCFVMFVLMLGKNEKHSFLELYIAF